MEMKALNNILLDLPVQLSALVRISVTFILPIYLFFVNLPAMVPAIFGVQLFWSHCRVAYAFEGKNSSWLHGLHGQGSIEEDLHDVARHLKLEVSLHPCTICDILGLAKIVK
jgi:hypothetical protein